MRKPISSQSAVLVPHRQFQQITAGLLEQGFESMKERCSTRHSRFRSSTESLMPATSPMLPALNREVYERVVGSSVERFTFDTKDDKASWTVKITFSWEMDKRADILVGAFPYKEHSSSKGLYQARIIPDPDNMALVRQLDDMRYLLSSLEGDPEIRKAADAMELRDMIEKEKVAKVLPHNTMVADFDTYVSGFRDLCIQLWEGQIQRLMHSHLAQQVMSHVYDNE